MRYVIYGAGAIGGTIGGLLHRAGRDVTLIARGEHLAALRRNGVTLQTPDEELTLAIPAVGTPAEADVGPSDTVFLTMKTQHTSDALDELVSVAHPGAAVVCAQNGVENERLALRRFARVYAMVVYSPAEHLAPGVVRLFATSPAGFLDVGRFPTGADEHARAIAADLTAAGYGSRAAADAMRWKFAKLVGNLANSLQALCGPEADTAELASRARDEAHAVYAAAGIEAASREEVQERTAALSMRPVRGREHRGGSSWQSLERGSGSIEAGYLNGEIALLGRLHGVPTPVNATLTRLALRAARSGERPGSMTPAAVADEVERAAD